MGCIPIVAVAVHLNLKIGQPSHKMYSNNILNFQKSTTILNACTKKSGNSLNALRGSNPSHVITFTFGQISLGKVGIVLSPSYGLNNTTIVLLQGGFWY